MSTAEHKTITEMENYDNNSQNIRNYERDVRNYPGIFISSNMSRETLRFILVGERPVSPSEIEE